MTNSITSLPWLKHYFAYYHDLKLEHISCMKYINLLLKNLLSKKQLPYELYNDENLPEKEMWMF